MIELDEIPCPRCDAWPMSKVGAAPDGSHLLMECPDTLCGTVSKVSG